METRLFLKATVSPAVFPQDGCFSSYSPCARVQWGGEMVWAGVTLVLNAFFLPLFPKPPAHLTHRSWRRLYYSPNSLPGTPFHWSKILAAGSLSLFLLTSNFKSGTLTPGLSLPELPWHKLFTSLQLPTHMVTAQTMSLPASVYSPKPQF